MITDREDLRKFVESVTGKKIKWEGQHAWKPGDFFVPDGKFFLQSGDWLMTGSLTKDIANGITVESRSFTILGGFGETGDPGLNGHWAFVNVADAMACTLSDVKVPEDLKNKFKHKCRCSLDQIFKGGCACGGI